MLHAWLDWQRAALAACLSVVRTTTADTPLAALLRAPSEVLIRSLAAATVSRRSLEQAVLQEAGGAVRVETVAMSPFARLVRLRGARSPRRTLLLLAPHSGYAATVLSPLVLSLVGHGELLVTEWIDARLVPRADGPFGLEQQVEAGLMAAERATAPLHLVALSQSGPAMLALAARLRERASQQHAPRSLAFLGCQLDPSVAPTALQHMVAGCPRELLLDQLLTTVTDAYPGAGRRVYPALLQLLTYGSVSPGMYAEVQHGLWRELATGQTGGIYQRQHDDMHTLVDVPAELFVDMLDWTTQAPAWTSNAVPIAGRPVDLASLRDVPLLTVEAARDELVGSGQTRALHDRLRPRRLARHVSLPQLRHHDLFTGPGFAAGTAPALREFYAALPD